MDTDFEDECKEIHRRRIEASDKLKKIDKDEAKVTKQITASPSKMQDILAIVSTACEVIVQSFHYEMNMSNLFPRFARARMTRTRCCCVTAVTRATTPTASSRPSPKSLRATGEC